MGMRKAVKNTSSTSRPLTVGNIKKSTKVHTVDRQTVAATPSMTAGDRRIIKLEKRTPKKADTKSGTVVPYRVQVVQLGCETLRQFPILWPNTQSSVFVFIREYDFCLVYFCIQ